MNMSKTKDKSLLYMKLQLKLSYPELHQLLTVIKMVYSQSIIWINDYYGLDVDIVCRNP